MARPLLALLTDFGLRDHYVATMKAVALGICPDAAFVDITHEIAPQDVLAAALELESSHQFFPVGTVFVVVVDPGVGTTRRAVGFDTGRYRFVGPDNGVFGLIDQPASTRRVELLNPQYARPVVSRTFEGRDRFAPAAAWLASGVDLAALGPGIDRLQHLDVPRARTEGREVVGEVLCVDRFGNLITNIGPPAIDALGPCVVTIGDARVPLVTTYADVTAGALCALVGSTARLEISVNRGNAATVLGVGRGTIVRVQRAA